MDDRILLAESAEAGPYSLEVPLGLAGFQTVCVSTGRDVLREAPALRPKLVALELWLPDLEGIEVVRRLREAPQTSFMPILVLADRAGEVERVAAFTAGADDFVERPFSLREVILRIRAMLRRAAGPVRPIDRGVLRVGRLLVDRDAHRVHVDKREVALTALELRLLVTLMERRDRVQNREVLLQDVWAMSADVTTRTVDTHIRRLRQKLGLAGAYIDTVRGVGYRFVGAPSEESP